VLARTNPPLFTTCSLTITLAKTQARLCSSNPSRYCAKRASRWERPVVGHIDVHSDDMCSGHVQRPPRPIAASHPCATMGRHENSSRSRNNGVALGFKNWADIGNRANYVPGYHADSVGGRKSWPGSRSIVDLSRVARATICTDGGSNRLKGRSVRLG